MPFQLPDEIEVREQAEGGILFRLPRRPMGYWRWTAVVPLVFGLLVAGFPIFGIIFFQTAGGPLKKELFWFGIFAPLGCHGPFCFTLGGYLMFKGLCGLYGHCEILIWDDKLTAIERCGPLHWSKRRDLTRVQGLRVEYDVGPGRPRSVGETMYLPTAMTRNPMLRGLAQLKADLGKGKTTTICAGYPREWLLPLAGAISRCCPRLGPDLPAGDSQPQVSEESLNPMVVGERYRQPSNSNARVEQDGDIVTITIPPAGLFRGMTPSLLVWCLMWNLIVWPFSAFFVPAAFAGKVELEDGPGNLKPGWAICFLTPFWLVALGSLIALIHCARRRASFIISPNHLIVEDVGIFSRNRHVWPENSIRAIRVESKHSGDGDSSWTISLVVEPKDGKPVLFLDYRAKTELEWLATMLREAWGLSENSADSRPKDFNDARSGLSK
jgi:hypothetical protein